MRTHRHLATLVLATALLAIAPTRAEAGQRTVGFGFNLAGGILGGAAWVDGEGAGAAIPWVEVASLELQIFPIDHFSLDFQWPWLPMVYFASGGVPVFIQANYFHFHFTPNLPISLAFAPMIRFLVAGGGGMVWPGMRLGLELNSPFKRFMFGIYLRPALAMWRDHGVTVAAFDGVIELTWTFYGVTGGSSKNSGKSEE